MHSIKEISVEQTIERKVKAYLTRLEQRSIPKPSHCQVCGRAHFLRWHGSYVRSLITLGRTYALPIKRLLCVFCGHTFALLPEFVMKFHHYARAAILHAVEMLGSRTYETVAGMFVEQRKRCIAILTLHFWRRKFA